MSVNEDIIKKKEIGNLIRNMKSLIAGKWVNAENGETIDVINPATNEVIDTIPSLTKYDIKKAIDAAYEAQKKWAQTSIVERCEILNRFTVLV